jgi:excisionase family DNA binding protein
VPRAKILLDIFRKSCTLRSMAENYYRPAFYTVKEAALILRVSDKTIRRYVMRGLLRTSKAIRKVLIPVRDVDNFFDRTQ